jgi:hypothetical protein
MKSNALKLALPVVAALVAGGNTASASSFAYSSISVPNEQNVTITGPNSISGGAGQIILHGASQDILAWCLDVFVYLQTSDTYNIVPLTNSGSGSPNPSLLNAQIHEIGSLISHGNALISSVINASAATQLAIWEIEYGFGNIHFSGNVVGSGAVALATQYYNNVMGNGLGTGYVDWSGGSYIVSLLAKTDNNQNLAFETPLPSTWTMLIGGFVGFGFLAYRGTKKRFAAVAAA